MNIAKKREEIQETLAIIINRFTYPDGSSIDYNDLTDYEKQVCLDEADKASHFLTAQGVVMEDESAELPEGLEINYEELDQMGRVLASVYDKEALDKFGYKRVYSLKEE